MLIPVQPSPLDGWASAEMLTLLSEARIYRPDLKARFVLNRCAARTILARETAETLAEHGPLYRNGVYLTGYRSGRGDAVVNGHRQ